jgi:hypothetical protein
MLEFKITKSAKPTHHFNREKEYFPFDKLEAPQGDQVFGFDVPIGYKSQVNYQLNHVNKDKAGNKTPKGINKIQSDKEYRMTRGDNTGEAKNDSYFRVIRVK